MKVVAIGGGGGAQQVLRGMLAYTTDLTAIIAVTDTGRSTGVARQLAGIPAPGDLRSTIAGLAIARDNLLARLIEHRLRTSTIPQLDGMAVGNLLLAALTQQTADFGVAVEALQHLVGCAAHVLPVATANTQLCAELADGHLVEGEVAVRGLAKPPIRRIFLREPAPAYPAALEAIGRADLVTIGPGSLFTTVIACLVFDGVVEALRTTPATVAYVCNTTTQPGQTDGFTPLMHVEHLLNYLGTGTLDAVLLNSSEPTPEDRAHHAQQGVHPILVDEAEVVAIAELGVRPLVAPLAEPPRQGAQRQLWNKVDTIRHHPARLAAALYDMIYTTT